MYLKCIHGQIVIHPTNLTPGILDEFFDLVKVIHTVMKYVVINY